MVTVKVGGKGVQALVDTGCSATIVASHLVSGSSGTSVIVAFDGRKVDCKGTSDVELWVCGRPVGVRAVVADRIIDGIGVVMGMDVIGQLGGVTVNEHGISFGTSQGVGLVAVNSPSSNDCVIEDEDFRAVFDGERWVVEWFFKGEPPKLKNSVGCYENSYDEGTKEGFEREVERWIEEGILKPWGEDVKEGVLPLMVVIQPTKNKVRPVLDFRELNEYVKCHTGDDVADVCGEVLREWRRTAGASAIVDLKSAYLQLHVHEKLWKYQLVSYGGKTYCLTRVGFGLNSAPRIMTLILKTVLGKDEKVKAATNSYIDDILVDETEVKSSDVVDHLKEFGLNTKPPEPLEGGAALGLRIGRDKLGRLVFSRGNEIPEVKGDLSRRELFSVCGKLVGHYPIAGWLRVACSYVKRVAEGVRWDDLVGERTVTMVEEMLGTVKGEDPVKGRWNVQRTEEGVVWCDASSIATGVVLEIGGSEVEDATWLRKRDDCGHINVAELDAVLKGLNLALKWGLRKIELRTDSATVFAWVRSAISGEKRIKTKGAAEMLVKRRLGIIRELVEEFNLVLRTTFVPTKKNRADVLTRVKKEWLTVPEDMSAQSQSPVCCTGVLNIKELHGMHHMGVDRTLFLARKVDPMVTREAVRRVVSGCERCQSIDPAPVVHERGEIHVNENWRRLALDVTHYRQGLYLSMIDCGPGRVAIWRELRTETAVEIGSILNEIFLERGPVDEVLMDNSTVFRSGTLKSMFDKWKVKRFFRAAYRPGSNGIVERHHRTIKAIAERGRISPAEVCFGIMCHRGLASQKILCRKNPSLSMSGGNRV